MSLGELLRSTRASQRKTLREVESLTGISNSYLCQLEADSIKQPSPNHLHKLALVYGVDYGLLMEAAGYIVASESVAATQSPNSHHFRGLDELTAEDRRKIQAYVDDLRDARKSRAS